MSVSLYYAAVSIELRNFNHKNFDLLS